MKYKKICNFCKKKLHKKFYVYNYLNSKLDGKFYECKVCDVIINLSPHKKLYKNQDSVNYNLNKNIFFYLKQVFLLMFIIKIRRFFFNKKKVLDYGCGSGELSSLLSLVFKRNNFYTCDVFNLKKKFIPNIKKHYLLNTNKFPNKKFDIIIMRHVFEHLIELKTFVKKIKYNLRNNSSHLMIEVPNINSIWRKIMNRRWPGYFYPYHNYVFSENFLKNFFLKNGYKITSEIRFEAPIFGTFFLTFGLNRFCCKFFSILIYPLQFLISKIFSSSESIMIIVRKNSD